MDPLSTTMERPKVDLNRILVIGAGELGMALLRPLAPRVQAAGFSLSVLVSPRTANPSPGKSSRKLEELRSLGVNVIGFDLGGDERMLTELFHHFRTVVNCSGFVTERAPS